MASAKGVPPYEISAGAPGPENTISAWTLRHRPNQTRVRDGDICAALRVVAMIARTRYTSVHTLRPLSAISWQVGGAVCAAPYPRELTGRTGPRARCVVAIRARAAIQLQDAARPSGRMYFCQSFSHLPNRDTEELKFSDEALCDAMNTWSSSFRISMTPSRLRSPNLSKGNRRGWQGHVRRCYESATTAESVTESRSFVEFSLCCWRAGHGLTVRRILIAEAREVQARGLPRRSACAVGAVFGWDGGGLAGQWVFM